MSVPTIAERIAAYRTGGGRKEVPAPRYVRRDRPAKGKIFLAIKQFAQHMSNEGWQLQTGLEAAGYQLCGRGFDIATGHVPKILAQTRPDVAVLQDKREWDPKNPACLRKNEAFEHYSALGKRDDLFRLTVLKDAQHNVDDNARTAEVCKIHAWIVYYHPEMVQHLAPYSRKRHYVRTWHSLDPDQLPEFDHARIKTALLSGATSKIAYPLRTRLFEAPLKYTQKLLHPGYHANGSATESYLKTLNQFRVAVCTCSVYGYALRKIIEATACGCRVVTDLPPDETLPEIDGNLIRISPDTPADTVDELCRLAAAEWDAEQQLEYRRRAVLFYNYRRRGKELAEAIEALRQTYSA